MAKFDTYQDVTDAVLANLEAGTRPWQQDWQGAPVQMPHRVTGDAYRGINIVLLWMSATTNGFGGRTWMTFKQAKELGGMVRKGCKGTRIVFFKKIEVKDREAAADETKQIPMLRTYTVFNSDQIDGLPEKYASPAPIAAGGPSMERDRAAEAALRSCGAEIVEQGDRAFYTPATDVVTMPDFERFTSSSGYLATLAHELCHWTGHKSRLDRFGKNDRTSYAFEELVAELGAAFIGSRLGIVGEHIDNHSAYLAGWLKALRDDKRAIFRAASLAQAAADMVLEQAAAIEEPAAAAPIAAKAPAAEPAPAAQLALI
jgi:antirestriction protein ArdC|tara:strand:+ start:29563 stop:30507 length:945 start_codon:yes stop_codon:yes gene_type:complete